jgi:uncharacterized protein (TIGR03067 family)
MVPTRLRGAATALLALAALGAALASPPAQARVAQTEGKGKGKSDKQLFQGKWEVFSAEKGGEKLPDEILKGIKLTVKGDKIEVEILGETKEGTFKLDTTKNPRHIDLTVEDKTLKGIYEFGKDKTLKVCAAIDENTPRPKSFKAEEQSLLVIFRRPAPEKKDEKKGDGNKEGARPRQGDGALEAAECSQEAGVRAASANNLKQIGLAMHGYHDANRSFPPAAILSRDGKPLLSWRVAILPYLDQGLLFRQFKLDEPWDSPHNKKLLAQMPKVFAPPVVGESDLPHVTYYRVFTGPGTIFEGTRGLRLTAITDGTANTILAVEAGEPVPWTKPDELPFDAKKATLPKLGGLTRDAFNVLMADGSIRQIRRNFDARIFRLAITRADGTPIDLEQLSP